MTSLLDKIVGWRFGKAKAPLPEVEEIRKTARLGQPVLNKVTVGEWLAEWIGSKTSLSKGTRVSYQGHIDNVLVPHLGLIALDKLRVAHVHAMFAAVTAEAEAIPAANAARRQVETAIKTARKAGARQTARELKAKLASMPPFRRPINAATRQRIRATLRSALSAACTQQLITVNVAALADLEPAKRPKALVWTPVREARWRENGQVPSAVMAWTGKQTAAFLRRAGSRVLRAVPPDCVHRATLGRGRPPRTSASCLTSCSSNKSSSARRAAIHSSITASDMTTSVGSVAKTAGQNRHEPL